jgi:hypothetical protein
MKELGGLNTNDATNKDCSMSPGRNQLSKEQRCRQKNIATFRGVDYNLHLGSNTTRGIYLMFVLSAALHFAELDS